ncbi:hypothetical protein [Oceanidesulfovibrio marinus]|uniref:hypothetical protein n=1 Tax=Oceanidesulfovibrio marinus TaxID=370038 RepID=UPI00129470B7|nr:hypothetical protein [Oceanidesulfovibrio marinus]
MYGIDHIQVKHQRSMAKLEKERREAARKRKSEVVRWDRSLTRLKTMLQRSMQSTV